MRTPIVLLGSAVLLLACSSEKPAAETSTKTKAQRDSAIGKSGLPGSQGVMKALGAADSARARQARIDSASKP